MGGADFDGLSLERLYERTSEKWSHYPPDVLPAFVAETDFELAPAVRDALVSAVDAGDCGYAHPSAMGAVLSEFVLRRFGWSLAANRVFTVPDVMAGVIESIRALSPDRSAVVINPPVYPPFFSTLANAGRPIVEVPLLPCEIVRLPGLALIEKSFEPPPLEIMACEMSHRFVSFDHVDCIA